jgi:hypothetical protein
MAKSKRAVAKKVVVQKAVEPGERVSMVMQVLETPTASAPDTPEHFTPISLGAARRLLKSTSTQVTEAPQMAREISASRTYATDFGSRAPAATALANKLKLASAWSTEAARAERWAHYAQSQALLAWDAALQDTRTLKEEFDLAVKHDAALPERYPSTTAFLKARREAAARGVRTRKAKKKSAGK